MLRGGVVFTFAINLLTLLDALCVQLLCVKARGYEGLRFIAADDGKCFNFLRSSS